MKNKTTLILLIMILITGNLHASISDGLVAYYPFNGNANDESGLGNHGAVNGAALTADRFGNLDSAYSFDGLNDYIDSGSGSSTLFNPEDSYTLTAWIMCDDPSGYNSIVARHDDNLNTFNYALDISENQAWFIADEALVQSTRVRSITELADNIWYQVVGVYDNKDMTLYLNGTEIKSVVSTAGGMGDPTASLYIGKVGYSTSYADYRYFDGFIDDVRIYDRALSSEEVTELYNVPEPCSLILICGGCLFLRGKRK